MKSLFAVFAVLSLLAISLTAAASCGDQKATTTGGPSEFPPITVTPIFKSADYTQPETCGTCHAEIYRQWSGSMMNFAFEDALYRGMHEQGGRETGGATDTFCSACHSPIGTFSGEVPPIDGPQVSDIAKKGVQCDFCHTVAAATGIGNYSFQPDPGPVKRGPYADSVSTFHRSAYSELYTRSDFCGMCHDLIHPGNQLLLEGTYTEWKNSPQAAQGLQCQDCHMTPGPGMAELTTAATGGPPRAKVFTHQFVGGNATSLAGPDHRTMAADMLKGAATIAIVAPQAAAPGKTLPLEVQVKNDGAGHYLPTGITEVREMWLEIIVTDAGGRELYRSGGLQEDGEADPQAKQYHVEFADADGNPTVKPWSAASIIRDNRIAPGATDTQRFDISLPADAVMPLTVQATLHYRSASPSLVRELISTGSIDLPVIDMATARQVLAAAG